MPTPGNQSDHHNATVSGATVVTKHVRAILQQQDIETIKEIPNLPEHQQAAKTQARKWEEDIWPLIIKTTTELIDFAITFKSCYKAIQTLLPKIEEGDEHAKMQFEQILEKVLIKTLDEKASTAGCIADEVQGFQDGFQPLYENFLKDFKQADAKMTSDNQEILDKKADLTEWQGKAQSYEYSAIGMGVALPITAVGTAVFAETGVGLVVGGILMASEVAAMATMLGLYADAMHHVNDLTREIHDLEEEVAQLMIIEEQITGLKDNITKVVGSTKEVRDGWIVLKESLINTVNSLKDVSSDDMAIITNINLDTAAQEWNVALKQAKDLKPDGGRLDAKEFYSSNDMTKAINEQAKKANKLKEEQT